MVSSVGNILNAAQLKQLAALRATARVVDDVQLRLASGLRLDSALDNPQNFFAARGLKYRADDLARLLDGIGQGRRTIEETMEGIESALRLLDQAESYAQSVEDAYMSGEIEQHTALPYQQFTIPDFISYAGAQDAGGTITITDGGYGFRFDDDSVWKRRDVNYTLTAETVLEFDYRSDEIPEISAIGFDNDNDFSNDSTRFFMYGTQTSGVNYAAPFTTYEYDGSGDWVHVVIPVGTYFTGAFNRMHFINDDDGGGNDGDSQFRNVSLHEGDVTGELVGEADAYEDKYAAILEQLDLLTKDAHYRGIHLLQDESLITYFNERNTSSLKIEGMDATSGGLGLSDIDFSSIRQVRQTLADIRAARELLRTYASSLAVDMSIMDAREAFTRATVDILNNAHDDLVAADQNEEGANLLALQTRQQLQMITLAASTRSPILSLFS